MEIHSWMVRHPARRRHHQPCEANNDGDACEDASRQILTTAIPTDRRHPEKDDEKESGELPKVSS